MLTTIKEVKKILTKTGFNRYLKSVPTKKFRCKTSRYCPIAAFLKFKGVSEPNVNPRTVSFDIGISFLWKKKFFKPPTWVAKFVRLVDKNESSLITSIDALKLLRQAVK